MTALRRISRSRYTRHLRSDRYAAIMDLVGNGAEAEELRATAAAMHEDFNKFLIKDGVVFATHGGRFRRSHFKACHRYNPCFSLFIVVPVFLPTLPSDRGLVVFGAAGFPRSFDDLSIAEGFQKALKMHD